MGLADFERSTHSPGHARFHLERIGLLADLLGRPHADVPAVHVAGTKGKGSTAAMVTSILSAQGYRVGLYTSPHLHSVVERIRVGLDPVSQEEFAGLVEQVWPAVESVGREGGYGDVTTFEMLTAMAFHHFRAVGADVQVVEVGLGGRLDSTNILDPAVSVITSISLDHVATLGGTLEEIASEKAGIIKPGRPVVSAPQRWEVLDVFRDAARRREAPLFEVDAGDAVMVRQAHHERTASARSTTTSGQRATIRGLSGSYDVDLPLLGDHQLENAATAVVAVETLSGRGVPVSAEAIVEGLRRVRWPGRLEVLSRAGPTVVVDGAHNPYSMDRLVEAVRSYFEAGRTVVVFGGLGGHSAEGMVSALAALEPLVVAVRSRHPRALCSADVARLVSGAGLEVIFQTDDVGEGTRRAVEAGGADGLVLATGSLSVAAEVTEEIRGMPAETYPTIKGPSGGRAAVVV